MNTPINRRLDTKTKSRIDILNCIRHYKMCSRVDIASCLGIGKSLVTIQKERNELQARRVKEAHEFNFDLMRVRHESTNYRTDKC